MGWFHFNSIIFLIAVACIQKENFIMWNFLGGFKIKKVIEFSAFLKTYFSHINSLFSIKPFPL
jgi:hypothetical protein